MKTTYLEKRFPNMKTLMMVFVFVFLGFLIVDGQNTDFDKKMGARAAKSAEAEYGMYSDKKMTAYVESVGKRLVAQLGETPFDFKFFIADDFTPNAFALPGG
jgi:predicted Zn-dependent protease